MSIYLEIQNVMLSSRCGKKIDVDYLVKYGGALRDLNATSVKYCFAKPSHSGDREVTVSVYPSGALVCLGASSVGTAESCMRRILGLIGCGHAEISLDRIVMSGSMDIGLAEIDLIINNLREQFTVSHDMDVMSGVIIISKNNTHIQLFAGCRPVKVVANGPDEFTIRNMISQIYYSIIGEEIPSR